MKRHLDHRTLFVLGLATVLLVIVGCTTRPQQSEELFMSGNHTAGDLAMVTADTASAGFRYRDPDLSPDGTKVAFTLDWPALPPAGTLPDVAPLIRQMAVIDLESRFGAQLSLANQGAALIDINDLFFRHGISQERMRPNVDWQKGQPRWLDDDNLLFWMQTSRGARLFRAPLGPSYQNGDATDAKLIYREPDDDLELHWKFWEHLSPRVSPDGRWVAFSRYGHTDADSLHQSTGQSIWVCAVPPYGALTNVAFQVTEEASLCDGPAWSPDGRKLVFYASLDLGGGYDGYYTQELFTVDFDTTGYAADGEIELNRNLNRLTYSPPPEGGSFVVRNQEPVYSTDGTIIAFVSDRRVPTITLAERNIWYIPADGSLEPRIAFFTRSDDVGPLFTGGPGREMLLSSSLGFPTEVLDQIWQEYYDEYEDLHPDMNPLQIQAAADAVREELAFFEDVMSHIYILSNW
ncbi:PD40 domain-containing protein [bacterium]|nr:PD40 domain-containing protein [bacterium]